MTKIIRRKRQKFLNSFLTLSRLFFYNLFSVICISSVRRVGIKIWNRTLKRTPNRTRKCTLKCSIDKKGQHARQHVRKYTLNFFVSSKLAQFLIVKILQRHFFLKILIEKHEIIFDIRAVDIFHSTILSPLVNWRSTKFII